MGLREDLLEAAERSAVAGKEATHDPDRYTAIVAAKTALEAIGLIGPAMTGDELTQALNDLGTELEAAGVFHEAQTLAPLEFLRAVLRGVVSMQVDLGTARQRAGAYVMLDDFVVELATEYEQSADARRASADDPARRIVARMWNRLEEARQAAGYRPKPASGAGSGAGAS